MKFRLFSPSNASITATIGGSALCTECSAGTGYPVAAWGDRTLRLTYNISGNCDIWQLDLVTASYRTALRTAAAPVNMTVFSVNDTAVRNYKLTATGSGRVTILRIPIDERGVSLVDTLSGSGELVWSDTGGIGVRYAVCNDAGMITLPDNDFSAPARTDLRGTQNSADYLVIAHPDFLEEAQRLAAHKKNTGFSACRAVSLADVYDNFSGGNVDPAAIRNFLAHARRYWTKGNAPDYVLLMGGGSYDYKSIKTSEKTFIPPFLHGGECIEDFFGFTDPDSSSRLSLAVGRITCRTRPEAVAAVDKIIASEDPAQADKGSWRNSILFIADDDMQLNTYDGIGHYRSSEKTISVVEALRPAMDIRKIYLFDYPWSGSMEKPGASRAIINAINNGVGYVNWYGHGSEDVLADEHVVTLADMPQFYNVNQYPLFTSFSCAVGKFDRPDNLSLGEAFVLQPRAGMIATFAAVREAYASDNEDLGKNLFRTLFDTAENQTLGMAIIEAKAHSVGSSKEIYALLGDPSLRINDPSRRVVLRVDTGGAGLDTLMALQQIRITGSVIDKQGIIDRAFDGSVQLGIYNAPSQTGRKDGGDDQTIVYTTSGRPVFSGKTVVRNGVFEQTALLPPSLSFDQTGPKLNAYAWSETATGSGSVALIFHGTRPAAAGGRDTTGPQISLRQIYDADNMGAVPISSLATLTSSLPLKFEIVLSDPAGVNVVGDGPDEGLTMEIPGYVSRRNINQTFQFDAGDYRAGAAVQTIGENFLKPGRYDLILSAQDLLGNVSRAKIAIEITDETALSLNHVFNAPNPFRMGESTRFFFFPSTQTQNARAQFVIKIYSLGGKLLRVIRNAGNGEAWNGRDQKEYQLPPNIYLYQVTADYTLQQKLVKSRIQKLVIHPPR
ncbi:MAG: C25 family cysteine peptidase [Chitinispirillaceae bacterium]|nr:C25 family cysteine peptidase [Chitinispirillaceae bacterium]